LFESVISESRLSLLKDLGKKKTLDNFYMAGGTAAALQIGHRRSVDFDFFGKEFDPTWLAEHLDAAYGFQVTSSGPGTLHGLIKDIKLSFLEYHYPLLKPTICFHSIELASLMDIALMKLIAVANRGSNKDFTDLYFICSQLISLEELLFEHFPRKYGHKAYSLYHIVRSLQYFDDAEQEPPLDMLVAINWDEIKAFFTRKAVDLSAKHFPDL